MTDAQLFASGEKNENFLLTSSTVISLHPKRVSDLSFTKGIYEIIFVETFEALNVSFVQKCQIFVENENLDCFQTMFEGYYFLLKLFKTLKVSFVQKCQICVEN